MPTDEQLTTGFRLGEWTVWPMRRELERGDEVRKPEPMVFDILMALARRDGDLATRDELVDEVWGGRFAADEAIVQKIAQLRKQLGDSKPWQYIDTLPRKGYRLVASVEPLVIDPAAVEPQRVAPRGLRRLLTLVAILLGIVVGWRVFIPDEPVPDDGRQRIAVLPFENLGAETDDYLSAGFRNELVRTLHGLHGVVIKSSREICERCDLTEVAAQLGADTVLIGEVQRNGDDLKISYELVAGRTGATLEADAVMGRVDELLELQAAVANRVRRQVSGQDEVRLITASRPANFAAYDQFMLAMYAFERRGKTGRLEEAIERFQETLRLDPGFGPAYVQLATAYTLLPDYRGAPVLPLHFAALTTLQNGSAVDPEVAETGASVVGFIEHKLKNWVASEAAHRRAINAPLVDPNAHNWYSHMLASVGRYDAALEQALKAVTLEPTNAIFNSRAALAHTWLGNEAEALRYFERADRFGADGVIHGMGHAMLHFRAGRADEAEALAMRAAAAAATSPDWIEPLFRFVTEPALRDEALDAFDAAVAAGDIGAQVELYVRTMLADYDGAMRVADLLRRPGQAFEMDLLFIHELEPLRQRPDFDSLLADLNIAEYWRSRGCSYDRSAVSCPGDGAQ